MIDIEEMKDFMYDVVGAIHDVHEELGPTTLLAWTEEYCNTYNFDLSISCELSFKLFKLLLVVF